MSIEDRVRLAQLEGQLRLIEMRQKAARRRVLNCGRCRAIWRLLWERVEHEEPTPSFREMAQAAGLKSSSSVRGHLVKLERAGVISDAHANLARSVLVLEQPPVEGSEDA